MKTGIINIFALPQEIDDLQLTIYNLKRNSTYLSGDVNWILDVTMNLSDELTNWDESYTGAEQFYEKFFSLVEYVDWADAYFKIDDKVMGCVSQRRNSLRLHKDADFHIWLDTDMYFPDITLATMELAAYNIFSTGKKEFIITPSFVRQWDSSWDMLVNPTHIDKPLMFHEECDIFKESFVGTNPDQMQTSIVNGFKFAGGWFTLISGELLRRTNIPDSLGHYGLEDTYVCACAQAINNFYQKDIVQQYIIKNLVVGENYKHRPKNHIMIESISKKEEFRQVAHKNFQAAVDNFRGSLV